MRVFQRAVWPTLDRGNNYLPTIRLVVVRDAELVVFLILELVDSDCDASLFDAHWELGLFHDSDSLCSESVRRRRGRLAKLHVFLRKTA